MTLKQKYMTVIKEHFDVTHKKTLDVMLMINENDQNTIMSNLAQKLYQVIIEKVDDIDFGTIPHSKGDIEQIENFDKITDSLSIMVDLITEYKQDITPIKVVVDCINNLRSRKDMFKKAYVINNELPITIYNTMALSIVGGTSFLISTCVEYIKDSKNDTYTATVDKVGLKKSKDYLLIKNMERFNNLCKSGEFDKTMDYVLSSSSKQLMGLDIAVGAAGVVAVTTLLLSIIPLLRECIYFFYYSRVKLTDYFTIQADLIQMNVVNMETRELYRNGNLVDTDEKGKILTKQKSVVDSLRKLADFFRIKEKKATNETEKVIKLENKKHKVDDVIDTIPDSASSLF